MKDSKNPQLSILLLLASFASVTAVLFTPALPAMSKALGLSEAEGQFAMTIFLLGYALGNLPYGPLANRLGRKPTLYIGISLAILGSLLIILVEWLHSYSLLIIGRFISAIGSSVGMKITFTMIGDSYEAQQATKKIAYVILTFAIAPGIAIALGGLLTDKWGWTSSFYFLTAYSILMLILAFLLPETSKEIDKNALNIKQIKEGFARKFKNKKLVACALIMGCATSIVYLFAADAPFIGIDRLGLKPDEYGFLNFIPPLGMVAGSFLATKLAGKKEIVKILNGGIWISFFCAIIMLLLFIVGKISIWTLFIPMPFLYLGLSLVFPNASGYAMSHAQNKSNASAVMNFINIMVSVITLFIVGLFPNHDFILPFVFLILTAIMFGLSYFSLAKN